MTTADLFTGLDADPQPATLIEPGALLLPGHALGAAPDILAAIEAIAASAPFRHMIVPGGHRMSVAMTNCGQLGWITDRRGYRYIAADPESGRPWPAIPPLLARLAADAAARAGYVGFTPDACIVNRYAPGAKMALHQDRDEHDFSQPIVSLSLGLPAVFLWGGTARGDKARRIPLGHGDVVVWGGPARLNFHGVAQLKDGLHPATGACRFNLTFRKAS